MIVILIAKVDGLTFGQFKFQNRRKCAVSFLENVLFLQELRKVLAHYPGREVRKGLDNLYKKVERHLCEEENLIQVVWRAMQEEFIQQYKCIEDLTQRCYPGAQISLDFTINDVLEYFSDIARSH